MKNNKIGFSILEVMIIVCILGLLLAIAVPSFIKARKQMEYAEYIQTTQSTQNKPILENTASDTCICNIMYDNHKWILLKQDGYKYATLVHHPDCLCFKK